MSNKMKMAKKIRTTGIFAARLARKYGPTALLMFATVYARAADAASADVDEMWTSEIKPLVDTILNVAIGIAVAWVAIMFFMGKKTALTIGGFVLLVAMIFRLFPKILASLMGISTT
jgi:hypothetical protein